MGAKKIFGTKANAAHAVIAQTGAPSSIKNARMRKPNAKATNKTNNGKKSEISTITQKRNVFNHQIPFKFRQF